MKFAVLAFVHLQELIFETAEFESHRQKMQDKSLSILKGLCLAYLYNNWRIDNDKIVKNEQESVNKK